MFDPNDTIVAVATPATALRSIIRISGPEARAVCQTFCVPAAPLQDPGIISTTWQICPDLPFTVQLYVFLSPRSYTGQDLVEVHIVAAPVVVQALVEGILEYEGLRRANAGEFTARAYLHGKLDLAQAEAVNEIIHSTNQLQLTAAQDLLQGRLGTTLEQTRQALMACLALLEAGLDFSEEDISFITREEALTRLKEAKQALENLLAQGLSDQHLIHLPSVGIAGRPNAGKSSLFNALLGRTRSIVSGTQHTTRDVVGASLNLAHARCVLFDCAGLLEQPPTLLDQLAQAAALESLQHCQRVLFCVDLNQEDWHFDWQLFQNLSIPHCQLIATQVDRVPPPRKIRLQALETFWGQVPLPVSAKTGENLEVLRIQLDQHLVQTPTQHGPDDSWVTLCARHRQTIRAATDSIHQARAALKDDMVEVAALLVRTAFQQLGETNQHVDEAILEQVFTRFCIGK